MSAGGVSFFFSSRRRHTRFDCDWSSDVCSSDLCIPGWDRRSSSASTSASSSLPSRSAARSCGRARSEEHTSELQSQSNLVCRLLLEKKKKLSFFSFRLHHGFLRFASRLSCLLGL